MKKWVKNTLWLGSIVVVCGMIASGTVATKYYGGRIIYDFDKAANENFSVDEYVKFEDNNSNDAINSLDSAEINIFFIQDGEEAYYNGIRLSMLSKNETHLFYSSYSEFNKNINFDKLEKFLKYDRKIFYKNEFNELSEVSAKSTEELKKYENEVRSKTSVKKLGVFYIDELIENVKTIMNNNKDKKINLWINSDNLRFYLPLIELAQVNNLVIRGIEDNLNIGKEVLENLHIHLNEWLKHELEDVDKSDEQIKRYVMDSFYVNRSENYLLPKIYKNIYFYFSYQSELDSLNKLGYENFNLLSNEDKDINDYILESVSKTNVNLVSYWNEIINDFSKTD